MGVNGALKDSPIGTCTLGGYVLLVDPSCGDRRRGPYPRDIKRDWKGRSSKDTKDFLGR